MRRATIEGVEARETHDISIHALHEESDCGKICGIIVSVISIHALHEESDLKPDALSHDLFCISIHALHEESDVDDDGGCGYGVSISIHALHEESDEASDGQQDLHQNFNPRSP